MRRHYFVALSLLLVAVLAIFFVGKTEDFLSLLGGISATMFGVFLALELDKEEVKQAEKEEFESGR